MQTFLIPEVKFPFKVTFVLVACKLKYNSLSWAKGKVFSTRNFLQALLNKYRVNSDFKNSLGKVFSTRNFLQALLNKYRVNSDFKNSQ